MDWKKLIADLQAVGVTQVQMAAHCGCAQTTISDIVNGRTRRPRYEIGAALITLHSSLSQGDKASLHPAPAAMAAGATEGGANV